VEEKSTNLINKLMKSTSLVFTIKTVARNKNRSVGVSWEVKRKTHDFEWLRNTLIKFYPGLVVPPLPQPSKSKEKIFGFQKKLEHFLLDCYRCPELKNSKYYEVFLSYSSAEEFENFVKHNQSSSKPKILGHILNMTGTIDTLHSKNIEQYGVGLQNYLAKTSNHLKQYISNHSASTKSSKKSTMPTIASRKATKNSEVSSFRCPMNLILSVTKNVMADSLQPISR
jgi:hypothetical protein